MPVSGLDHAPADRIAYQARGFVNIQFFHNTVAMGLCGFNTDVQQLCCLTRRLALSNQLQDLAFPGSERVLSYIGLQLDSRNYCLRKLRTEISFSAQRLTDGMYQVVGSVGLGHKTLDPNPQCI